MEEAPEFITVPADPQFHKSVSSLSALIYLLIPHPVMTCQLVVYLSLAEFSLYVSSVSPVRSRIFLV